MFFLSPNQTIDMRHVTMQLRFYILYVKGEVYNNCTNGTYDRGLKGNENQSIIGKRKRTISSWNELKISYKLNNLNFLILFSIFSKMLIIFFFGHKMHEHINCAMKTPYT